MVIPYAQCTPQDDILIGALKTKFNPNSTYADFMDEIDHLGPSTFNGTADDRLASNNDQQKEKINELTCEPHSQILGIRDSCKVKGLRAVFAWVAQQQAPHLQCWPCAWRRRHGRRDCKKVL